MINALPPKDLHGIGDELSLIQKIHTSTKRDYMGRMVDNKLECMEKARTFEFDYWDGSRRTGYGGYVYDGRWAPMAKALIGRYDLRDQAKILDVGAGKGYLLYEFKKLLPDCTVVGMDISKHAMDNAHEEVKDAIFFHKAQERFPYANKEFDLVVAVNTLHNLAVYEIKAALQEIDRVGRNAYIVAESYRNFKELHNMQCWTLTAEAFYSDDEWKWLFKEFGYTGDFEFIHF